MAEKKYEKKISNFICSEKENDIRTKDILNNKTSKENNKLIVTIQGLRMLIKNMGNMKELGMYESTNKRKRRQIRTDGYLLNKEDLEKNILIDEENSSLDMMYKMFFEVL